jgi:hypothetical protein
MVFNLRPIQCAIPTAISIALGANSFAASVANVKSPALVVTNCNDSGAGSLRDAIENLAVDGDVVDLTRLKCGQITLVTGAIVALQGSIEIHGPGRERLLISGGGTSRVFDHEGVGRIVVTDLSISDGLDEQPYLAYGGCVYSAGYLTIANSDINHCIARTTSTPSGFTPAARGGGAFGMLGLNVIDTSMLYNSVAGSDVEYPIATGGAISSSGPISVIRSYIAHNSSTNDLGGAIVGSYGLTMLSSVVAFNEASSVGGVSAFGDITVDMSAIVGNVGFMYGGGLAVGSGKGAPAIIKNTTISGNNGPIVSGMAAFDGNVAVYNCTIAFNSSSDLHGTVGLMNFADHLLLESSIVANNTWAPPTGAPLGNDIDGRDTLLGSHNLIVLPDIPIPGDTIREDPLLEPLAYNGGVTPTHALSRKSPAIDVGSNETNAKFDQRGRGYARIFGEQADIGAYELNADELLVDGFDD